MNEHAESTASSDKPEAFQFNPLTAELATMVEVTTQADSYHAVLTVSPNLSVLVDHFEQQPILPGVCMVQVALLGASRVIGRPELSLSSVKNAKMVHPIFPGDVVDFQGQVQQLEDGSWQIKTKLTMGERRVAELSLIAR